MRLSGRNFQAWSEFSLDIEGLTILTGPSDTGKCLAPGTPVLMYDGSIKLADGILLGDLLMGSDSKPRRVLSLAHGWGEMYEVIPKKGDSYKVNGPHVLSLVRTAAGVRWRSGKRTDGPKTRLDNAIVNLSVQDYLRKSQSFKRVAKGYRVGVDFPEQPVAVDPYFFGLWLGDGRSNRPEITSDDVEVVEAVYATAAAAGLEVSMYGADNDKTASWHINTGIRGSRQNSVLTGLRGLGVIGNKHIPLPYKANSRRNRLELLAGLMDSDGSLDASNNYDFVSKVERLAADVCFTARSLGLAAYMKPCEKTCTNGKNGPATGRYYRVCISGDIKSIPVRVARKLAAPRRSKRNVLRTGITVRPAGYGEYFGFEIGGDGLFLLGDFTVTHNSALFRALKGVLRNELPAEWVRDGQDEPMEVTVEAGGYRIAASRSRKGSTKYEVTPGVTDPTDKYAALAGGVPDVVKGLKYGEVTIGTFDVDPLFGRQNSAQFLIDPETFKPAEVNAILGAFGGTEKLERGKKEANLRKTQKDAEARSLAEQIRGAEERKASLAGMQAEGQALSAALHGLEGAIRSLETETYWLGAASGYRQRIVPLRQIMDALILPDTTGLEQLNSLSLYAEQAADASAYARWLAKPLSTVSSAMEDWAWVRGTWNTIAALEGAVEAGRHVVATDGLRSSLTDAERTYSEAVRLWNSISRLEVLSSLLGELKGSADRLAGVEAELSAAQAELKKGLCPKCGFDGVCPNCGNRLSNPQ
jgi:hypothetical protein